MSVLRIGALRIRYSWAGVSKWGYSRIEINGYSLLTRQSDGALGLISYHPRWSNTWIWSVALRRSTPQQWTRLGNRDWRKHFVQRCSRRRSQWHDYYRLPFGRTLIFSHQDYHVGRPRKDIPA